MDHEVRKESALLGHDERRENPETLLNRFNTQKTTGRYAATYMTAVGMNRDRHEAERRVLRPMHLSLTDMMYRHHSLGLHDGRDRSAPHRTWGSRRAYQLRGKRNGMYWIQMW